MHCFHGKNFPFFFAKIEGQSSRIRNFPHFSAVFSWNQRYLIFQWQNFCNLPNFPKNGPPLIPFTIKTQLFECIIQFEIARLITNLLLGVLSVWCLKRNFFQKNCYVKYWLEKNITWHTKTPSNCYQLRK